LKYTLYLFRNRLFGTQIFRIHGTFIQSPVYSIAQRVCMIRWYMQLDTQRVAAG